MITRARFLFLAAMMLIAMSALADPPGRVGRISMLSGDVRLHNAATGESQSALVNWPLTSGDVISTGAGARAELRIASTALRLDQGSELAITQLDDEFVRVHLVQGSIALRIRDPEFAREFELATAHGRALPLGPGRYRFDTEPRATAITAYQGRLRIDGIDAVLTVHEGERAEIWDAGRLAHRIGPPRYDEFHAWIVARDQRDDFVRSTRYVSPDMTGYEDLDHYGDWYESSEYGPLWYPRSVPADWAPYRVGHWAWIEPWGWTWVDHAPWGFAPFHYGRWVHIRGAWAWAPGIVVRRPVYAPALVAWVGRPGWTVGVHAKSAPAVGWYPLAPREVFYPGYRATSTYVRNINVTHVEHVHHIDHSPHGHRDLAHVKHAHRGHAHAVTVVPADVVARGKPVTHAVLPVQDVRTLATLPVNTAAQAVGVPRPSPVIAVQPSPTPRVFAPSPIPESHRRPDERRNEPRRWHSDERDSATERRAMREGPFDAQRQSPRIGAPMHREEMHAPSQRIERHENRPAQAQPGLHPVVPPTHGVNRTPPVGVPPGAPPPNVPLAPQRVAPVPPQVATPTAPHVAAPVVPHAVPVPPTVQIPQHRADPQMDTARRQHMPPRVDTVPRRHEGPKMPEQHERPRHHGHEGFKQAPGMKQ
jgi:FecR protein